MYQVRYAYNLRDFTERDKQTAVGLSTATLLALYAHWEGFVKFAAEEYVMAVGRLDVDIKLLDPRLLVHNFPRQLKYNEATRKFTVEPVHLNPILAALQEGRRFRSGEDGSRPTINTQSNLWLSVLKSLFNSCGIDCDPTSADFQRENRKLYPRTQRLGSSQGGRNEQNQSALRPINSQNVELCLPEFGKNEKKKIKGLIDWLVGARNHLAHGSIEMRQYEYGLDYEALAELRDVVAAWSEFVQDSFVNSFRDGMFLDSKYRQSWAGRGLQIPKSGN